jgi:hypothetical protein
MPTKFVIPPNQSSYSVTDGETTISTKLDGGASRYRRDILNAYFIVDCEWRLSEDDYQYFRAFYNTETTSGSLPFLIDLIIDDSSLTEHEAQFVPNTIKLSVYNGAYYTVRGQLEVKPIPRDTDYDSTLVMLFSEYGGDTEARGMLDQLEQLTNVDFVESL